MGFEALLPPWPPRFNEHILLCYRQVTAKHSKRPKNIALFHAQDSRFSYNLPRYFAIALAKIFVDRFTKNPTVKAHNTWMKEGFL